MYDGPYDASLSVSWQAGCAPRNFSLCIAGKIPIGPLTTAESEMNDLCFNFLQSGFGWEVHTLQKD